VVGEGDVLYLPAFWWHEVVSSPDDHGRNIAVNYWCMAMQAGLSPTPAHTSTLSSVGHWTHTPTEHPTNLCTFTFSSRLSVWTPTFAQTLLTSLKLLLLTRTPGASHSPVPTPTHSHPHSHSLTPTRTLPRYDPVITKEFPCADCKLQYNPDYDELLKWL
jgi:cupin-like protein